MTSLENSMPMTTTLMNRMSKRKDMVVGTKYIIKQQRLSEPTDQVCSIAPMRFGLPAIRRSYFDIQQMAFPRSTDLLHLKPPKTL